MKRLLIILSVTTLVWVGVLLPVAHGKEVVTVLLDWFVNPDHGPLYVALEKGFFDEQGLDLHFVAPSNPNDPPKLVAAGKADMAVSYQPQHYLHVAKGLPLVRIATLVGTPLNTLVVMADGDIHTPADLKGKTIGYSVGGFESMLLKVMLSGGGLTLEDVRLVNVNFSLSPALFAGKADAVIGAFRNFELNQMEIEGRPGRAFYVEEHGIPAYDELIVVAHRKRLADPMFKAFVQAIERGVQFMINHPDESWRLFVRGRPELDNELNRRAWKDTLPRFALRPAALDRGRYRRFGRFLQANGMLSQVLPVADLAVDLFE